MGRRPKMHVSIGGGRFRVANLGMRALVRALLLTSIFDVSGGTKNLRTTTLSLLAACLIAFSISSASGQKHAAKKTSDSGQTPVAQPAGTAGAQSGDTQKDKDKDEGEDKGPWKGLQYRLVGPFRGGRVVAVSGVVGPENANVYYFGAVAGGVWKTTDGGL